MCFTLQRYKIESNLPDGASVTIEIAETKTGDFYLYTMVEEHKREKVRQHSPGTEPNAMSDFFHTAKLQQ